MDKITACALTLLLSLAGTSSAQERLDNGNEAGGHEEVAAFTSAHPTIAVLDFDHGAVKEEWPTVQTSPRGGRQIVPSIDSLHLGTGVADLLVGELAEGSQFRFIERQRLVDVARERQGGDAVRARYLIMGAVTKFGGEKRTKAGFAAVMGLLSVLTHRSVFVNTSMTKTHAYVGLSCRVIDTTTDNIVGTASGAGQSKRRGLLFDGRAAGRSGRAGGGIRVDSSDFQATILGEATTEAVKEAASRIRVLLIGLTGSR